MRVRNPYSTPVCGIPFARAAVCLACDHFVLLDTVCANCAEPDPMPFALWLDHLHAKAAA